jgi:hypothetical protein
MDHFSASRRRRIEGRFICMPANWRIYANSNCSLAEREINLAHVSQFTVQRSKRAALSPSADFQLHIVRLIIELFICSK